MIALGYRETVDTADVYDSPGRVYGVVWAGVVLSSINRPSGEESPILACRFCVCEDTREKKTRIDTSKSLREIVMNT